MKFNKINKIILFGGARLLAEVSRHLKEYTSLSIVVFSSKRHLEEAVNELILKEFLEREGIKYYDSEDINKDENLKKEATENTLGIAIGAAWIFEKETVALFKEEHLLDFMGIDLPRYRGGAHYTWQILNQNKKGCANLQVIRGGKESFHKGEIIKRKEYLLPEDIQKPIDYFDFIVKKELEFLQDFLKELENEKEFGLTNLDETQSSYYPFLYTKINGFIDWNWSGKDIFLFVNAFDDPYNGTSTYLRSKRVFLKGCRLLEAQEKYHPFASGVVVRKNNEGIFIASVGNLLLIRTILDEDGKDLLESINVGDRLYTPQIELEKSKEFKAEYDSQGLKNE